MIRAISTAMTVSTASRNSGSSRRRLTARTHRHSKLSAAVKAVIAGLGPYGYIVAMQAALQGAGQLPATLPGAMRIGPR